KPVTRPAGMSAAERAIVAAELAKLRARMADLTTRLDRLQTALAAPAPAPGRSGSTRAAVRSTVGAVTHDPRCQVSRAGRPGSSGGEAVSSCTATSRPGTVTAEAARPCQ